MKFNAYPSIQYNYYSFHRERKMKQWQMQTIKGKLSAFVNEWKLRKITNHFYHELCAHAQTCVCMFIWPIFPELIQISLLHAWLIPKVNFWKLLWQNLYKPARWMMSDINNIYTFCVKKYVNDYIYDHMTAWCTKMAATNLTREYFQTSSAIW